MTKREEGKIVKANHKKLYLKSWAEEKARGMSLSAFCKAYGLSRKNFYLWLKEEAVAKKCVSPIKRAESKLKAKAVEIFLRYKGTWCPETISLALKGLLSPVTIRKIIAPYRHIVKSPSRREKLERSVLKTAVLPNIVWSVDWTEFKIRGKKFFILFFMDEASRFYLGWYIFSSRPTGNDAAECLRDILARYEARPFIIKSDRAKVFSCAQWLGVLARAGLTSHRIRPHCPQDQGVIERGMREIKTWLRANNISSKALPACLDEGMFMLNFLKPKIILNTATPAAVYLSQSAIKCESPKEELCSAS